MLWSQEGLIGPYRVTLGGAFLGALNSKTPVSVNRVETSSAGVAETHGVAMSSAAQQVLEGFHSHPFNPPAHVPNLAGFGLATQHSF